jgi:hypothetical protein
MGKSVGMKCTERYKLVIKIGSVDYRLIVSRVMYSTSNQKAVDRLVKRHFEGWII